MKRPIVVPVIRSYKRCKHLQIRGCDGAGGYNREICRPRFIKIGRLDCTWPHNHYCNIISLFFPWEKETSQKNKFGILWHNTTRFSIAETSSDLLYALPRRSATGVVA